MMAGWLFVIVILMCSCQDDADKKWGYAKIYMPQASILNGGINHNYPVPLHNNAATENYVLDEETNTLRIVLGVYRSGLQALNSYSVKVAADANATSGFVASVGRGVALPDDVYTLPAEVSVPTGSREAIFYLSVDLDKLVQDYAFLANKKLCLSVAISDPDRYELKEELCRTDVIIDGPSFLPVPPIIKGGDFSSGSEAFWTKMDLSGEVPALDQAANIAGGYLAFNYGTEKVSRSVAVYQPVELVEGNRYKFSATASGTGAETAEMVFILSPEEPQKGMEYDKTNNYFSLLDVWWDQHPNFADKFNGTFPQSGQWEQGFNRQTGEFTANFTKGYMIILVTTWNGTIGNVTFDNIKIEEL